MDKAIAEAIRVFKNGGIVIFPTDTAYAIGCRIDNENAVKRLFKIRKRPENKPLLALVNSVGMAEDYLLTIPRKVKEELINPYWPGKLTIVLRSKINKVPSLVTAGTNTLGVRLPDNKVLLELIAGVEVPILAPSANFSGEKTPFKFKDLDPDLVELSDFVLSGEAQSEKNVSTIIDCSNVPWKIIREGAVKLSL